MPKDISETDKINLEKLKDLIRGSKEQDRLKMMQYFSQLQENWFDTREKTKTIIDFENYIDTSSALDTKTKESFYSLLEGFLLADTQVKDDIGLATKVLKSLIPKTNSSYAQIMKNIDDINSHPTNTTLNKELGTFILNAIKDDTTIEVKDKNIIKSQLQTIIYGGQNNIPKNVPPVEENTNSSALLNFILGFGKILGFVLLGLFGIFALAFVYFKIFNKNDNIGFQDFIIDKMSGKKSQKPSPNQSSHIETAPVQKEEKQIDVLANITPNGHETTDNGESSVESVPPSSPSEATIPDWLKESTSLISHNPEDTAIPEDTPLEENSAPLTPPFLSDVRNTPVVLVPEDANAVTVPDLPDWLKASEPISTPEEGTKSTKSTEQEIITHNESDSMDENMSDLPAWMKGVDQESLKQEVAEEINNTMPAPPDEDASYDNIPDWLRNTSPVTSDSESESPDSSSSESKDGTISSPKKQPKTPQKEESNSDLGTKENIPPKAKKKKSSTNVSE